MNVSVEDNSKKFIYIFPNFISNFVVKSRFNYITKYNCHIKFGVDQNKKFKPRELNKVGE